MSYVPVPRAGLNHIYDLGHDEALIEQMCHFGECVTFEPGTSHPACVPGQDPPVQFMVWVIFEWREAFENINGEMLETRKPYLGLRVPDFADGGPGGIPAQDCRFIIRGDWFQVAKVEEEHDGYVECHLTKWITAQSKQVEVY